MPFDIPEEYKKPLFELGRFVATLAALALAMQMLGVATKDDLHERDIKILEARYRIDVVIRQIPGAYFEPLEPEAADLVDPVGP